MNNIANFGETSISPLPAPLAQAMLAGASGLPKRERTRRALLTAAIQVFTAHGVAAATIQEIASVAGMAPGTVYNHFRTKDDVVQSLAGWLADTLCRRISASYEHIREGAERMAIGNRRYLWLAEVSPQWALLLLDVAAAAPHLLVEIRGYALADLKMGIRQKSFRIASEAAAMDLINGAVAQGMRSLAYGRAPSGHASAVATMVLRGLGMDWAEAAEVARRPLPELPVPPGDGDEQPAAPAAKRAARKTGKA